MWGKPESPKKRPLDPFTFAKMSTLRKISTYKDVYPTIAKDSYNPSDFKEKVIIVTGSGSGIGKATALAFAEMGSKVAFTDLTLEAAETAAKEAEQKFGAKTIATKGDVRVLKDMEYLMEDTRDKLGPVDCVVFAAGYGMFDTFDVSRVEDWWGLIETNLKGPTDLTRLVIKDMIKRNTGTLIYISSRVPSLSLDLCPLLVTSSIRVLTLLG